MGLAVNVDFTTKVDYRRNTRVWLIGLAWCSRVEVYQGAPLFSVIRDIQAVSRLNKSLVHRYKAHCQRLSTIMKTVVHIQYR